MTMDVIKQNVAWAPIPNEVHHILADTLPPRDAISAAFALAFDGDQLLVTHLSRRGWDVPGGHLESGETPEDAMRREVYEETGARLGITRSIGYQMIRVLAPMPRGYRYAYPDSYQVCYWARILALDPFPGNPEAMERALLSPVEASHMEWVRQHRGFYEAALALATTQ